MHKVRNDELSESMTSMFNSSNTQHLLLTIAGGTTFLHEPLSIKKTKKRKGMNEKYARLSFTVKYQSKVLLY